MDYDGLMTHLRSIPVGIRIADWMHANYPALAQIINGEHIPEPAEPRPKKPTF